MLAFDFMSAVFPILFAVTFLFVFGIILYTVIKSISQSRKNAASPRIVAPATIVAKRYSVRSHADGIGHRNTHAYSQYYITFEFESGDRMEFPVFPDVYGLSVEGDRGNLCFQGTKFISFTRT